MITQFYRVIQYLWLELMGNLFPRKCYIIIIYTCAIREWLHVYSLFIWTEERYHRFTDCLFRGRKENSMPLIGSCSSDALDGGA